MLAKVEKKSKMFHITEYIQWRTNKKKEKNLIAKNNKDTFNFSNIFLTEDIIN